MQNADTVGVAGTLLLVWLVLRRAADAKAVPEAEAEQAAEQEGRSDADVEAGGLQRGDDGEQDTHAPAHATDG